MVDADAGADVNSAPWPFVVFLPALGALERSGLSREGILSMLMAMLSERVESSFSLSPEGNGDGWWPECEDIRNDEEG